MKKAVDVISKTELKFWIPMIGIIVSGVTTVASIRSDVRALELNTNDIRVRERENMSEFNELIDDVDEIKATVIEIHTNQKHIMNKLNIE